MLIEASPIQEARPRNAPRFHRLWQMQPRGRVGSYYIDWGTARSGESNVAFGDVSGSAEVATRALDLHARWHETADAAAYDGFLRDAIWLRNDSMVDRGPRVSATAQSLTTSVLIRAHEARPTDGFLVAALRAATPLSKPIDAGGLVARSDAGDVFFEDLGELPMAHRLDGAILGCWGLFELERVMLAPWVHKLVGPAIGTLQRRLATYDAGGWSYEDALVGRDGSRRRASVATHDLHVALLHVFASMTLDPYFESVARMWTRAGEPIVIEYDARADDREFFEVGARPLF